MIPSVSDRLTTVSLWASCMMLGLCLAASASTSVPLAASDDKIPPSLQAIQAEAEYHIGPSDILDITVYQEKDLDRQLRVSQTGTIDYPLVGSLHVGGLSVGEAVQLFQSRLSQYLIKPQVTILIVEYKDKKIFVLGEVKKAGAYPMPSDTPVTVLEAITMAGGFTDIAAAQKTSIIRSRDGKKETLNVDLSRIAKKSEKQNNITVYPNDIVFVPQTFF